MNRSILLAAALLPALAACGDRSPSAPVDVPAPPPPAVLDRLECRADVAARRVGCGAPGSFDRRGDLVLGGNGRYVKLRSSAVTYDSATQRFSFNVTVQNLIGQALGTSDGATADPAGVRVFFTAPPSVTTGTGEVSVDGDGLATFTTSTQPYYQYDGTLPPGGITTARRWTLEVPPTAEQFAFTLLVSAPVQYPDGWLLLAPRLLVGTGETEMLAYSGYDRLGNPWPADVPQWSSDAPGVATVNAGYVHGEHVGVAGITLQADRRSVTMRVPVAPADLNGAALSLGGARENTPYLRTDSATGPLLDLAFTVEAWVRWAGGDGQQVIIARHGQSGRQLALEIQDGALRAMLVVPTDVRTTPDATLQPNRWTHVAVTYDSYAMKLYLDGVPVGANTYATQATVPFSARPLLVGRELLSPAGFDDTAFHGEVDEVRVWSGALSAEDLAAWYARPLTMRHPRFLQLQAYYPLDEAAGTVARDFSGFGHDATLLNGAGWAPRSP